MVMNKAFFYEIFINPAKKMTMSVGVGKLLIVIYLRTVTDPDKIVPVSFGLIM